MFRRIFQRRRRRSGLTTVEYVLVLFLLVFMAIFGYPALVRAIDDGTSTAGNAIEDAGGRY